MDRQIHASGKLNHLVSLVDGGDDFDKNQKTLFLLIIIIILIW